MYKSFFRRSILVVLFCFQFTPLGAIAQYYPRPMTRAAESFSRNFNDAQDRKVVKQAILSREKIDTLQIEQERIKREKIASFFENGGSASDVPGMLKAGIQPSDVVEITAAQLHSIAAQSSNPTASQEPTIPPPLPALS